jgi:hypothetical protein
MAPLSRHSGAIHADLYSLTAEDAIGLGILKRFWVGRLYLSVIVDSLFIDAEIESKRSG